MAATYSDLYAACGVHSGLPYGAARDVNSAMMAMSTGKASETPLAHSRVVPVIVFHGDRDTVVNPRNADLVVAQASRGLQLTTRSEQGSAGGRTYARTLLSDDKGQTVIEQWTIYGAGHAWSGGSPKGSFTDSAGPDASGEMMRFFLQHRI
jgi:poly(3-hydroxybutyrate) depolymerase